MTPDDVEFKALIRLSRFTPGLKPGDGEKIGFSIGEEVRVISGVDEGRIFHIISEPVSHLAAPGLLCREGYFLDDPGEMYCKAERTLWPQGM